MDVVSLGSAVLDRLFSVFRDRHRADARVGERHHAEITAGVLVPLRQRVGFLLAILEQRTSPVAVEGERLPAEDRRPRAVGTAPVRYREILRARVPAAEPVAWIFDAPRLAPVDRGYYDCTKTSHLTDPVRELEALVDAVGEYCGRCLRFAENLKQALAARSPVPATFLDVPGNAPWLKPVLLADHLLKRRLGVDQSGLWRNESEGILRERR